MRCDLWTEPQEQSVTLVTFFFFLLSQNVIEPVQLCAEPATGYESSALAERRQRVQSWDLIAMWNASFLRCGFRKVVQETAQ